jgi:PPK2 family polyphosphate:nucleotide phosphotransferase
MMPLELDLKDFMVMPQKAFKLAEHPTRLKRLYHSKKGYRKLLSKARKELTDLQKKLYAHDRYVVLLIFQGMDTSGKSGVIKHVISGVNPAGLQVHSFNKPSTEELAHDFMWRTNRRLPERGRIGIFDRSYYEEVLIARVHSEILRDQKLPPVYLNRDTLWQERFQDIVNLEDYLNRNGTLILKFMLHLSKEEQKKRFLSRIENPKKNWKFSEADINERQYWDDYQYAFQECLSATSTYHAPWYVVPADDKRNARLVAAQIIVSKMAELELHFPQASQEQRQILEQAKARLLAED